MLRVTFLCVFPSLFLSLPDVSGLRERVPERTALMALLVSAVVVAPILEEMIFRGLVQSALRSLLGPWATVIVASTLFAALHYGAADWVTLPGLLVLALILGWLYERTGSLWPGIIAHAGFNLFNVAQVTGKA